MNRQQTAPAGRAPARRWTATGALAAAALVVAMLPTGAAGAAAEPMDVGRAPSSTTVTLTIKGGAGKTLLLLSRTGQTLATKAITSATAPVTLTVPKTRAKSLAGASLHLIHSATAKAANRGEYFGPVTLGWKSGTTRVNATRVFTRIKATTATAISLGTVQVASPTARQGYAYAVASQPEADSTVSSQVRASAGRPCGVGNYGLSKACGPLSAPGRSGRSGRDNPPIGDVSADASLGGDKDDDGIPNAFDVNDDGDTTIDSADSTTPIPAIVPELASGALCAPVEFRIFTNFKATQPRFAGTLNYYGPGAFEATKDRSANAIEGTMSMVFNHITQVCGSNVVKTELKGVGVPYAPSDYTVLGAVCNTGDYQWLIGQGRMCGPGNFVDSYEFAAPYDFTATTMPSGQDTFMMRLTTADGKQFEFTSSAGFVFVTHPMLVAYSINSGEFTNVDYSQTAASPDGVGLEADPAISIGADDVLSLRFYRPQRLRIDGEVSASDYVDLGGFRYSFDVPNLAGVRCDAQSVTDTTMPTDTATVSDPADAPTLTLEVNLGDCVRASGTTWTSGAGDMDVMVQPQGPGGNSAQKIRITRLN